MKKNLKHLTPGLLLAALFTVIILSNCTKRDGDTEKKCCEGYTGTITDSSAKSLVHKCHFMRKDSIVAWVARYQANKLSICNDSLPGVNKVLGDSCSFNRCIIKAIICNDDCIGLRVLYGMSPDRRVHIILVGVKADYSTLYIKQPTECCGRIPIAPGASGNLGGAEYAQMP